MSEDRIAHEKEHGKKIASNAEAVWNWASPAGKIRAERRANYLISEGGISATDKVLELGCGTGLFTEKIYKATKANIIAGDISEDLLEVARKKVPEVVFKLEDAMNLNYPEHTFDVVCGSSILHHLDMEQCYKEILRVLKPGGRMVFAEPNMVNPQIFIQKNIPFIKKMLGDSPDETAIVRWKSRKQLEGIGFTRVNIFPFDFLHPYIPKPLIGLVNGIGKIVEKIPLLREIAGSVIMKAEKPI